MKTLITYSIIFINFFSQSAFAGSNPVSEKVTGKTKVVSYDYNDDKKIDLIETYESGELVKKEQDLDFDGVMDETREIKAYVSDTEPVETITRKDRKLKVYRNEKLKLFITTTEIDTDGDGKYDKTITDHEAIGQKKGEACDPTISPFLNAATVLEADITKAMGKLNNGFIKTDFGYKIHQSCFSSWGVKTFSSIMSQSMGQGLSCLSDLAQKNTKANPKAPNGALNNLMGLKRLIEKDHVSIVCNEAGYDWKGTAGHASTSKEDKITNPKANHPFISLSPAYPKKPGKGTEEEVAELTKTIFHEQLHNLGIRHGEGIEYPYSCETCCLPTKDDSKEAVTAACKICSGQYESNKAGAESYVKDAVVWGEVTYNSNQSLKAVVNYIKENPKSQSGIILFARANAGIMAPVGTEMAKILKSKFPKLSKDEQTNLDMALQYKDSAHISAQASKARVLAEANIALYYDNDPAKALSVLESNKAILKSIVAQSKKKPANTAEKYTFQQMFTDSKKALVDIWLQNYPKNVDDAKSDKAYTILKEVGLI
ncbi:hypothetical protein C0V70_14210 [Bacteriovorax stolpii]|uniref:Uncharacterized protein n=1 Tax=Bacteriovorax stolpii TaxID=960 RepID=A0A2K9NUM3_BACTC|nr:hypothetical protein [Bacteriovorax stolpii]AUN99236.1 hypothetical protein C0V70_14210 [Bacteriovorax stolpii]TDP55224.1 hypothetical protein C8D79_0269 [Bacteriovorax stolpii]